MKRTIESVEYENNLCYLTFKECEHLEIVSQVSEALAVVGQKYLCRQCEDL